MSPPEYEKGARGAVVISTAEGVQLPGLPKEFVGKVKGSRAPLKPLFAKSR